MNRFILFSISLICLISCKKNSVVLPPLSSINVINAVSDAGSVKVNYFGGPIAWSTYTGTTAALNYGSNAVYSLNPGSHVQIVRAEDTTKNLFNAVIISTDRDIYSLYLTGTVDNPESVVNKENIPAFYVDSALNVRVINLSPNSEPLNITLGGTPDVNEFAGIAYKQQSEFKKYTAASAIPNSYFTFEARDNEGNVLATYAFTPTNYTQARFRSVTLAFRGMIGGTDAATPAFSFVPNY